MQLSKKQLDNGLLIVKIGKDLGKTPQQIRTAVKVAFMESSLNAVVWNKGPDGKGTAKGLFQYNDGAWESHSGERYDPATSTKAFYQDMQIFEKKFSEHRNAQINDPQAYATRKPEYKLPPHITLEEYIYIKHHDGRYSSNSVFVASNLPNKGLNTYLDHKRKGDADAVATQIFDAAGMVNPPAKQTSTTIPLIPPKQASILDYYDKKDGLVHVTGYTRNGVHVSEYDRSWPDGDPDNNIG